MKRKNPLPTLLFLALLCQFLFAASLADAQTLIREWKPDELARWSLLSGKNMRVENGALTFETAPGDAQLVSPAFEKFAASPWQRLELDMQSDFAGRGGFFWTGTTAGLFGGFAQEKVTGFAVALGSQTYRIRAVDRKNTGINRPSR